MQYETFTEIRKLKKDLILLLPATIVKAIPIAPTAIPPVTPNTPPKTPIFPFEHLTPIATGVIISTPIPPTAPPVIVF